jgi:NhaP-type Na+/H+ or K+/H+ antiporter
LYVVTFMGTVAEAAVYSYIGIALLNAIPEWWSFSFIFSQFALIVVGRVVAVFCTFYAFKCCCKTRTINVWELCFITYAGMIRGAIAFALVLTLPVQSKDGLTCSEAGIEVDDCFTYDNYTLMVSTTLMLVVLTTLVFGTFMGIVQSTLVAPSDQDREEVAADHRAQSVA